MNQNQALEQFIDQLVTEKGLANLDDEVLSQVKKDLLDRVEDRINAKIVSNMPPEKLEEFEKLLDTHESEKLQKFSNDNIPGLQEIIAAELLNFRQVYLNA